MPPQAQKLKKSPGKIGLRTINSKIVVDHLEKNADERGLVLLAVLFFQAIMEGFLYGLFLQ